ncbi:hypothetical protein GN244_ATG07326 [Phytophthora infestans]|uniref:Uncharacterized protein n=1 Tax=Phytophthora infestans TaxID=4787 RepID=A0A833TB77_PHYIN|nr:hypothetical protein GN244_ATG07326 [Phytophthora infestans]
MTTENFLQSCDSSKKNSRSVEMLSLKHMRRLRGRRIKDKTLLLKRLKSGNVAVELAVCMKTLQDLDDGPLEAPEYLPPLPILIEGSVL